MANRRLGIVKPQDAEMPIYGLIRGRNVRVYEVGAGRFPNLDEALYAAKDAHLGNPVDYSGKTVVLERKGEDETVFMDVEWSVAPIDENAPFKVLKDDYVTSGTVQELMEELALLSPDWPSDIRALRALCERARRLVEYQIEQSVYEDLGGPTEVVGGE